MKKVVLGMLALGLTSLVFSQEPQETFLTVALDDVTLSSANVNYLQSVRDRNTPEVVRELQEKAATYAVTSNVDFDKKNKESFGVVFKASNGDIVAYYNRKGEILSAHENFKNVVLPMEVRKRAFEENDGWVMSGNKYVGVYQNNDVTNRVFKIQLRNRDLRKNLVIDLVNDH